ncbi:hypothetical protein ABH942_001437 [Flavobacterium sp. 28YEA47A]|uniref:energy transducer TonB n=1 Tax=Flavobacterium sp. 28YEA47A TaxID=3156276 RepID=UPI0035122227
MLKKILFSVVLSMTFSMACIAQETKAVQNPTSIPENKVAIFPKFQGGDHKMSMYQYAQKNYVIPKNFKGNGVMLVDFIIDTQGNVTSINVINDLGYGSAEAAVKLLKNMPKWTPAYDVNGNPIEFAHQLKISLNSN